MFRLSSVALALACTSLPALAQHSRPACNAPATIRFKPGASFARETGVLIRGEVVCYVIRARANQTLRAAISSPDENVEFQIYLPGYSSFLDEGETRIKGAALPGAGELDDARRLNAKLPVSGEYVLALSLERGGGGSYSLNVAVRN